MTANTSIETSGHNSERFVELEEELLRDTHPVECHAAWHWPFRTPTKAGGEALGTQTVQRTEVQELLRRGEERSRESFLRFRGEWVKNRARDIRQAGSNSFNTCSEDTASITALNEFYRYRIFDGFYAGLRDEKEMEIGMAQGLRDFGTPPRDVAAAEKLDICRTVCRENGRKALRTTCHRLAKFRD